MGGELTKWGRGEKEDGEKEDDVGSERVQVGEKEERSQVGRGYVLGRRRRRRRIDCGEREGGSKRGYKGERAGQRRGGRNRTFGSGVAGGGGGSLRSCLARGLPPSPTYCSVPPRFPA